MVFGYPLKENAGSTMVLKGRLLETADTTMVFGYTLKANADSTMVFKGRLLENADVTMVFGDPLKENADSTTVFKSRDLKKAGRFLKNADTRLKTQGFLIKILALGCPGQGFPVESVAVSAQAREGVVVV